MAKERAAPRDPLLYPAESQLEACRMHDEEYGQFEVGQVISFSYTLGSRVDRTRDVHVLMKSHDEKGNVMYTTYDYDVNALTAAGHIRKYRSIYM